MTSQMSTAAEIGKPYVGVCVRNPNLAHKHISVTRISRHSRDCVMRRGMAMASDDVRFNIFASYNCTARQWASIEFLLLADLESVTSVTFSQLENSKRVRWCQKKTTISVNLTNEYAQKVIHQQVGLWHRQVKHLTALGRVVRAFSKQFDFHCYLTFLSVKFLYFKFGKSFRIVIIVNV